MSSEIDLNQAAARGERAAALLRDELLTEAFAELEKSYIEAWQKSQARDTEAREKLWLAVQVLGKVKGHLETVVNNGALARHDLNELTARPKRFGVV